MKKNIVYYPGCIESQNKSLEDVFKKLGLDIELISEWNCCGAPPSYYKPSFFNKVVMPLRNLGISQRKDSSFLYSGCQVCVRQINDAVKIINSDSMFKRQADYSLAPFNSSLNHKNTKTGSAGAKHLIDIITIPDVKENILNNAVRTLDGDSVLLYTGCNADSLKINDLKEILKTLGAKIFIYDDCCGGEKLQNTTPVHSKRIENANGIGSFFKLINQKADETGSDYIVAVCSMCEKNIRDGIELSDLSVFAPIIGLLEYTGFLLGLQGFGEMIDLIHNGEKRELSV